MKKLMLIFFTLFTAGIGLHTTATAQSANGPQIKFDTLSHDFGTFKEGEVHDYIFHFTNTGNAPLVVKNVEQPCGCTIPSWSQEPVMPGKRGEIKVIYNSKDRPGVFRKTLQVETNTASTGQPLLLLIKGVAAKRMPAQPKK